VLPLTGFFVLLCVDEAEPAEDEPADEEAPLVWPQAFVTPGETAMNAARAQARQRACAERLEKAPSGLMIQL
jgi:hypothetical protein